MLVIVRTLAPGFTGTAGKNLFPAVTGSGEWSEGLFAAT